MITPITGQNKFNIFQAIDSGNATRIDQACFRDGYEDEYVIEFFLLPDGTLVRSCYNKRTTCTEMQRVEDGWERDALLKMI